MDNDSITSIPKLHGRVNRQREALLGIFVCAESLWSSALASMVYVTCSWSLHLITSSPARLYTITSTPGPVKSVGSLTVFTIHPELP